MISKINRLSEREVKKVLTRGKPFFSYGIVLNYMKNHSNINRYAIVIGGKSVKTNIDRVFFRRSYYDIVSNKLNADKGVDFVFVVKKQTKLDKRDKKCIITFVKDIKFLLNKI